MTDIIIMLLPSSEISGIKKKFLLVNLKDFFILLFEFILKFEDSSVTGSTQEYAEMLAPLREESFYSFDGPYYFLYLF